MAAVEHQRFADQPGREFGGIEGEFTAAQAADTCARARNARARGSGDGSAIRKRKRFRSLHWDGISQMMRNPPPLRQAANYTLL